MSDLRLSIEQPASNRVGVGEADLLLVLDQLVGSLPKTLATASERTVVVGSTTVTPTGREVRHPDLPAPGPAELAAEIAEVSAPTDQHWADFTAVANDAFGSSTTANVIGVGMAVQLGALPISPERIEEAIALNGTAVTINLRGFQLGRQLAHRPDAVHAALAAAPTDDRSASPLPVVLTSSIAEFDGGVRPIVERCATDLIGFQDVELAERYVGAVARIAEVERAIDPGTSKLTTAVAENLHRVMAYKDEYEVARLILDPAGRAEAERMAGARGVIRYRLHPPLLRDHGLDRKIALGAWADPMFRVLARGKRLRGTRFDPFGRTTVRREERRFAAEYVQTVDMIVDHLSPASYDVALEIAALPETVRGYETLKLERLTEFHTTLADLIPRLIDRNHASSTIIR